MLEGYPRVLTWVDFREVAQSPHPPFDAQGAPKFSASTRYRQANAKAPIKVTEVTVRVYLEAVDTWVVTGKATDPLLRHEQGHFDITGLIARDLDRALQGLEAPTESALKAKIQAEVVKAQTLLEALQSKTVNGVEVDGRYDAETNHSQNELCQTKWNDVLREAREKGTSLTDTAVCQ